MWALGQDISWDTFDCQGTRRRWRILPNGRIDVDGIGTPKRAWPKLVNQWAEIIAEKAAKYSIPAQWIAAIMALESGGKPGLCIRKSDGTCNTREGIGLMAMVTTTAAGIAGRKVTQNELLNDHDLQIDLGAKLIAKLAGTYHGDYVKIAIGYNAGSVKCAMTTSGSTWNLPKETCPPTPWGVIMGCIRTDKSINAYCAPSTIEPSKFVCPVDYPHKAIAMHNTAIEVGWTDVGLGGAPVPANGDDPPLSKPASASVNVQVLNTLLPLAAGAVVGYLGYTFIANGLQARRR